MDILRTNNALFCMISLFISKQTFLFMAVKYTHVIVFCQNLVPIGIVLDPANTLIGKRRFILKTFETAPSCNSVACFSISPDTCSLDLAAIAIIGVFFTIKFWLAM